MWGEEVLRSAALLFHLSGRSGQWGKEDTMGVGGADGLTDSLDRSKRCNAIPSLSTKSSESGRYGSDPSTYLSMASALSPPTIRHAVLPPPSTWMRSTTLPSQWPSPKSSDVMEQYIEGRPTLYPSASTSARIQSSSYWDVRSYIPLAQQERSLSAARARVRLWR